MSIEVRCANGHLLKVKDSFAGKTGLCPVCRALVRVPQPSISEDDILHVVGEAAGQPVQPPPDAPKPAGEPLGEPAGGVTPRPAKEPPMVGPQRKKVCPKCNQFVSYYYAAHCPRCGAPLSGVKTRPPLPKEP